MQDFLVEGVHRKFGVRFPDVGTKFYYWAKFAGLPPRPEELIMHDSQYKGFRGKKPRAPEKIENYTEK